MYRILPIISQKPRPLGLGVCHFEIPFDDKERVTSFYQKVFGWQFQDIPEMNYCMARSCEVDENQMPKNPGAINSGMYNRKDGGSQNPVLVMNVSSLEEAIGRVEENGGSIVFEPRQVGDIGRYCQVKDSEGNIIGLWQSLNQ